MRPVKQLKAHPWLFAGLAGLPFSLHCGLLIFFLVYNSKTQSMGATNIPDWAYSTAFACLPVLSLFVGIIVACLLSLVLERWTLLSTSRHLQIYGFCFIATWIIVFGYLSFFTFIMGLGALPAPFTLQQFLGRVGTVFLQFPISGAISLVVCAAATGIVMLILRPFERKQS